MILKKDIKDQFANNEQISITNKHKVQESLCNLLHFIQRQKLKNTFGQLLKKKDQVDQASKALFALLHGY